LSHNYNSKYERDESLFPFSDRQFPRKGESDEVSSCCAPHSVLRNYKNCKYVKLCPVIFLRDGVVFHDNVNDPPRSFRSPPQPILDQRSLTATERGTSQQHGNSTHQSPFAHFDGNIPIEVVHTVAPEGPPLQSTEWMMHVNETKKKLSVVKRKIAHSSQLPPNAGPRRSAQVLLISQLNLRSRGLSDELISMKQTRIAEIRKVLNKFKKLISNPLSDRNSKLA
jgi:hypothetical protein